jgi:hypothetical protein
LGSRLIFEVSSTYGPAFACQVGAGLLPKEDLMPKKPSTVDIEFSLGGKPYAYKTTIDLQVGDEVYVVVRGSERRVGVVHVPSLTPKAATASILRKAED